jgi:hypothetical protein
MMRDMGWKGGAAALGKQNNGITYNGNHRQVDLLVARQTNQV